MNEERLVLPALWETPALPSGHNGGPPLPGYRRWGTAEDVKEAILDALGQGMPVKAIARLPGMPPATTIRHWRERDEAFGQRFDLAQQLGWHELMDRVTAEMERNLEQHGHRYARKVFAMRRHQLARQAPSFFAGP